MAGLNKLFNTVAYLYIALNAKNSIFLIVKKKAGDLIYKKHKYEQEIHLHIYFQNITLYAYWTFLNNKK